MHRIELWALDDNLDYFPDATVSEDDYRAQSIYDKNQTIDLQRTLPLSRTIRVGEVKFGIDKLGHFVSLGHKYFQNYFDYIDQGLDDPAAIRKVIEDGYDQEAGWIGETISGVFSYADMEANFQGLLFAYSLCQGPQPRLAWNEEAWRLERPIDMREYVNPWWDESFNNSTFSDSKWEMVRGNMKPYCALLDESGQLQHGYAAASLEPSESMQMIMAAAEHGIIPAQQRHSLPQACKELNYLDEPSLEGLLGDGSD